ncbi:hypothetical protein, partial [Candidatus Kuenenia stuttgartiensis]|uniref:hypothetical protein n=1 Tax=Kuenenia stuttgartiensis TaxID=174633 RepID=UPI00146BAD93
YIGTSANECEQEDLATKARLKVKSDKKRAGDNGCELVVRNWPKSNSECPTPENGRKNSVSFPRHGLMVRKLVRLTPAFSTEFGKRE